MLFVWSNVEILLEFYTITFGFYANTLNNSVPSADLHSGDNPVMSGILEFWNEKCWVEGGFQFHPLTQIINQDMGSPYLQNERVS